MKFTEFELNEIEVALVNGLQTDGGHHKQYYLEKALRWVIGPDALDELKEREDWEDGIPS